MKAILLSALAIILMCTGACAQGKQKRSTQTKKAMIAYFSATGTTRGVAQRMAKLSGTRLHEIQPAQPYTAADLDWHDATSRSSVEMNDAASRPAVKNAKVDLSGVDVVFIGFPIWWDLAPRVINTFIEANALKGKTVVPFATSGGSSVTNAAAKLRKAYPDVKWRDGKLLNSPSDASLRQWLADEMK